MALNEDAFYAAMRGDELEHYPGEYAEIAYSIKELCTELEKFMALKNPGGAAGDAAGRRIGEGRGGRGHGHGGRGRGGRRSGRGRAQAR